MKDNKKVKYNLLIGFAGQAITMLLGVLVPRLVLTSYGSEVNGLLSSVTNIYSYVALVEAGITAASCQALYKSIAEKDQNQTNAVMSATNRYFHKTGIIYLLLICAFAALYPVLIDSEIPYGTIVLVILFNGFGNVVNYFFHGKYLILLKADGKNYVRTALDIGTSVANQIAKIVLMSLGYDVVFVQLAAMLASFVKMLYITFYIKKHYTWLDLSAKPDFSAVSQSKHVLVHEVNYLITSNVDTVLLTLFTTLKTVSVYSMYTLLLNMVTQIMRTVRDALEFKVAYEFHRDRNAFLRLFEAYEVFYITFAFILFSIVNYFILPFLALYTKGVTDVNYVQSSLPFLFIMPQLLTAGRYASDAMVHIAGHFEQTKKSAAIESTLNLISSLLLVHHFGIAGVLFGTILSSLYRTNYLVLYVNRNIIGRSPKHTYKCWIINFAIYLLLMYLNQYIVMDLTSYVRIFAFCVPYALGVAAIYLAAVCLLQPRAFRYVWNMVKSNLRNKTKGA